MNELDSRVSADSPFPKKKKKKKNINIYIYIYIYSGICPSAVNIALSGVPAREHKCRCGLPAITTVECNTSQ